MARPYPNRNWAFGAQGRSFHPVTLRPSGRAAESLSLNTLFIPRPLLFDLVVTPAALGPCQPGTGHRQLQCATWHEAGEPWQRAQRHRACGFSAPSPVALQGPVGLSFARTWPTQGWERTGGSGAGSTHADRGPTMSAQSREEGAARVPKPGAGTWRPPPVEPCWVALDQSWEPPPRLPGT